MMRLSFADFHCFCIVHLHSQHVNGAVFKLHDKPKLNNFTI